MSSPSLSLGSSDSTSSHANRTSRLITLTVLQLFTFAFFTFGGCRLCCGFICGVQCFFEILVTSSSFSGFTHGLCCGLIRGVHCFFEILMTSGSFNGFTHGLCRGFICGVRRFFEIFVTSGSFSSFSCGLYHFFNILIIGSSLNAFLCLPNTGSPANFLLLMECEWLISIHGSQVLCKSHDTWRSPSLLMHMRDEPCGRGCASFRPETSSNCRGFCLPCLDKAS
jgi:hypothetical protein